MANRIRDISTTAYYKHLDAMLNDLYVNVGFCLLNIIRATKFLSIRQMINYDNFLAQLRDDYREGNLSADDLVEWREKHSYIKDFVNSISITDLICMTGKKRLNGVEVPMKEAVRYLKAGLLVNCILSDMVLQKHYRFSRGIREAWFDHALRECIAEWQRGNLSRHIINQMFLEDYGFDIVKGDYVK